MSFPLNKPDQGDTDWADEINENWTDLDALEAEALKDSDVGVSVQACDADLAAIAGLTGTGLVARTGAGTAAERSIAIDGGSDALSVSNGDGVSGNPTLSIDALLQAIKALSSAGLIARTGAGTAAARSVAAGSGIGVTNGDGASGNPTVALDIPSLAALTAPATGDSLAIVDADDSNAQKEITLADLLKVIGALTEDTTPDGANDFLTTYDASATAAKKVSPAHLLKAINDLTADTAPDGTNDLLVTYDASASAAKKVTPENLLKVIGALTADASPDGAADYVVTYDASAAAAKKVLLDDLPGGGAGLSDVAIQVFTSSGTYTPTTGMKQALIICTGSGGGGGGADTNGTGNAAGGGGGAGGTAVVLKSDTDIGASRGVTINAGGTGGNAAGGGNGGTPSANSMTSIVSANGGTGGSGANVSSSQAGGDGGTGGTSSGTVSAQGGDGEKGWAATVGFWHGANGGVGGASFWGGGGRGSSVLGSATSAAGQAGRAFGSGGGGASCCGTTTGAAGGDGKAGVVVVVEFLE